MTRIIAGKLGSLRLKAAAKATRPTSDRVKESLFSQLQTLIDFQGKTVLDLYAGTGALGLEAASRGAAQVTFVESDKAAHEVTEENIRKALHALHLQGEDTSLRPHKMKAEKFLCNYVGAPFDLVFLDPPYELSDQNLGQILQALRTHLLDKSLVVIERASEGNLDLEGFTKGKSKKFGGTEILILITDT